MDLVGREPELAALQALLADAYVGKGGIALLEGEPGIGKTRTAEEFAQEAPRSGARVLWGRCYHDEGAPAFWPWVQVIRAYARGGDPQRLLADMGPGAADIAQLVPEVGEWVPKPPSSSPLDPAQARFRLFESITRFLRDSSQRQPLVLVLDDLHWADKPSLLLLEFLSREVRQSRLLLVATYRDVEVKRDHPLVSTLAELARQPACRRIPLRGLSEQDVARFIEHVAGRPVSPQLVSAVYLETEGNPFFVAEVVQLLKLEGPLLELQPSALGHLPIPPTVRDVIRRRLHHLSTECSAVLSIAAVIGREFRLAILQRASDIADDPLLDALEQAADAGIITVLSGAGGLYSFSHALIRDTLYEQLGTAARVRAHRQVGEALETLYDANPEPHLAELAYHFYQAAPGGDADRAIAYAVRAAERATAQLAYEEAARHYQMALDILESAGAVVDEDRVGVLLIALGEAQSRAGDRHAAQVTLGRAAEIARQLGLTELLAQAALGYGGPWVTMGAVDKTLVGLLEEALGVLAPEERVLRARVLARLAMELYFSDDRARCASLSHQAVELARQGGDAEALAYVLSGRCFALWGPDDVGDRLEAATELVRLAEQAGDEELVLQGHLWRAGVQLDLGAIHAVRRELDLQARLAERLRQPVYLWQTALRRALLALLEGRFEDGESLAQQALALGERVQPESARGSFAVQMLVLRREQGRLNEVKPIVKDFAERYPAVPGWRGFLAQLYSEEGCMVQAQNEFEQLAVDSFSVLPRDYTWLSSVAFLSEVCASLGDADRAAMLYQLLLPYAERNVVAGRLSACVGPVARFLGMLARMMGRYGEAAQHFEEALASGRRMGARPLMARTQYEYGALILAHSRPDELDKARSLIGQALATARELGMVRLEQQVLTLPDHDARSSSTST
jgi:tetratricopeptide (TPR) repeat protein